MSVKYIALNVETGGLREYSSLLTVYIAILDRSFNIVDQLDFKLKPKDGDYLVNAKALAVNKINLVEHDEEAILTEIAGTELKHFLAMYKSQQDLHLIPIGHNVKFDINMVTEKLINKEEWEKFVSYRALDTASIAQFLKITGKIPEDVSGGLQSLVQHFKVNTETASTAKGDTKMIIRVLKAMMELV